VSEQRRGRPWLSDFSPEPLRAISNLALRHFQLPLFGAMRGCVYPKTEEFRGSREEVDWRRGF
jgi:hypothetical protein